MLYLISFPYCSFFIDFARAGALHRVGFAPRLFPKPHPKKVALVPGGAPYPLRYLVADEEVEARVLRAGGTVKSAAFHIVLRLVVGEDAPLLHRGAEVVLAVGRFVAVLDVQRRHALHHEAVLVAADEAVLRGLGVGLNAEL